MKFWIKQFNEVFFFAKWSKVTSFNLENLYLSEKNIYRCFSFKIFFNKLRISGAETLWAVGVICDEVQAAALVMCVYCDWIYQRPSVQTLWSAALFIYKQDYISKLCVIELDPHYSLLIIIVCIYVNASWTFPLVDTVNWISFVFSFRHKTQDAQQSPLTVYQTVMDEAGTLNTWVKEQKTKTHKNVRSRCRKCLFWVFHLKFVKDPHFVSFTVRKPIILRFIMHAHISPHSDLYEMQINVSIRW